METRGNSPAAGNSGTRKQMALFGGRVSRFLGSPKSFRFENLRGVSCRHFLVSEERYRDFLWMDRGRSFPAAGNSVTRKQMALFGGRVSRFFGPPKSFRFGNLRGVHCRHLSASNARYRDFCGWSEGETSRQLETQLPGSKWPFLGVEFPGFRGLRKVSDLGISMVCNAAIY